MHRINLGWFCELGGSISEVKVYRDQPSEALIRLFRLMSNIDSLVEPAISPLPLRASRPLLTELRSRLQALFDSSQLFEEYDKQKTDIFLRISTLGTVLFSELAVQSIYQVSQKRAYDIDVLADDATRLFSEEVRAMFSEEEKHDITQAGRCLAFEVPTAAAFHIFRAMESAIREYYNVLVGQVPKTKMRNWGTYIKYLKTHNANPAIMSALEQIKDLHRNPIIHPETQIKMEEALSLIGVAESLIAAMKTEIARLSLPALGGLLHLPVAAASSSSAASP